MEGSASLCLTAPAEVVRGREGGSSAEVANCLLSPLGGRAHPRHVVTPVRMTWRVMWSAVEVKEFARAVEVMGSLH